MTKALFLTLACVSACTFRRAQVVVEVHADGVVQAAASELRIEVRNNVSALVFERVLNPRGSDFPGFPLELPISAQRGEASRTFELRVSALATQTQGTATTVETLAQNRVRTSFRQGEVSRLRIWLLSGCRCNTETERCEPDVDGDAAPDCAPIDVTPPSEDAAVVDHIDSAADVADADGSARVDAPDESGLVDSGDSSCTPGVVQATLPRRPVDMIWVIDNSRSMGQVIESFEDGIGGFIDTVTATRLDYRVIVLSMRRRLGVPNPDPESGTVLRNGSVKYPVCLPPPLGSPNCQDGPRALHVDIDIRSTTPIEQILGSLAQTTGYRQTDELGGAPWRTLLREDAAKAFVFVTDDNARVCSALFRCSAADPPMDALGLESFPGGSNPFNSDERALGPGILTSEYGSLFENYIAHAIYGYSSESTPSTSCRFADGTSAASSGPTYTTLLQRTNGVRARICDASAITTFFSQMTERTRGAAISCRFDVPTAPAGIAFSPQTTNVQLRGTTLHEFARVDSASACTTNGWYFVSSAAIQLCPDACSVARRELGPTSTGIDVAFGCASRR